MEYSQNLGIQFLESSLSPGSQGQIFLFLNPSRLEQPERQAGVLVITLARLPRRSYHCTIAHKRYVVKPSNVDFECGIRRL